jgi:hypothetical protein
MQITRTQTEGHVITGGSRVVRVVSSWVWRLDTAHRFAVITGTPGDFAGREIVGGADTLADAEALGLRLAA